MYCGDDSKTHQQLHPQKPAKQQQQLFLLQLLKTDLNLGHIYRETVIITRMNDYLVFTNIYLHLSVISLINGTICCLYHQQLKHHHHWEISKKHCSQVNCIFHVNSITVPFLKLTFFLNSPLPIYWVDLKYWTKGKCFEWLNYTLTNDSKIESLHSADAEAAAVDDHL